MQTTHKNELYYGRPSLLFCISLLFFFMTLDPHIWLQLHLLSSSHSVRTFCDMYYSTPGILKFNLTYRMLFTEYRHLSGFLRLLLVVRMLLLHLLHMCGSTHPPVSSSAPILHALTLMTCKWLLHLATSLQPLSFIMDVHTSHLSALIIHLHPFLFRLRTLPPFLWLCRPPLTSLPYLPRTVLLIWLFPH